MIKSIADRDSVLEIDLTGPEGNAFVLIGHAKRWAKQLGLDPARIQSELMEGDYENLLQVMERYFGEYAVFLR